MYGLLLPGWFDKEPIVRISSKGFRVGDTDCPTPKEVLVPVFLECNTILRFRVCKILIESFYSERHNEGNAPAERSAYRAE
jgi:hypothetical protein